MKQTECSSLKQKEKWKQKNKTLSCDIRPDSDFRSECANSKVKEIFACS